MTKRRAFPPPLFLISLMVVALGATAAAQEPTTNGDELEMIQGDPGAECVAFELQTSRLEGTLPAVALEMLSNAYMERAQALTRVIVLSREERDAWLQASGVLSVGEINQRAADNLIAGTDLACHLTAGVSFTEDFAGVVFQASLDDNDPATPPLSFVETRSSLVDAEMLIAINALGQALEDDQS